MYKKPPVNLESLIRSKDSGKQTKEINNPKLAGLLKKKETGEEPVKKLKTNSENAIAQIDRGNDNAKVMQSRGDELNSTYFQKTPEIASSGIFYQERKTFETVSLKDLVNSKLKQNEYKKGQPGSDFLSLSSPRDIYCIEDNTEKKSLQDFQSSSKQKSSAIGKHASDNNQRQFFNNDPDYPNPTPNKNPNLNKNYDSRASKAVRKSVPLPQAKLPQKIQTGVLSQNEKNERNNILAKALNESKARDIPIVFKEEMRKKIPRLDVNLVVEEVKSGNEEPLINNIPRTNYFNLLGWSQLERKPFYINSKRLKMSYRIPQNFEKSSNSENNFSVIYL